MFVQCILKYKTIKTLKIPHKYGSTTQIFCIVFDKHLLRHNSRGHELQFLEWCCLIHM